MWENNKSIMYTDDFKIHIIQELEDCVAKEM